VQEADGRPAIDVKLAIAAIGPNGPLNRGVLARRGVNGRFQLAVYRGAPYRILVRRSQRVVYQIDMVATESPLLITLQPK
jgi:hypothetical protein